MRLSVTPVNTKAYWVDHDFPTRGDAQEAVARIAIQDGVLDAVRRELPRFNQPQPHYQQQQQQYPQNGFGARGPPQNPGFGVPYQHALQQRGPPPQPFRGGGGPGPRLNGHGNGHMNGHMNGNGNGNANGNGLGNGLGLGNGNGKPSQRPPAPQPVAAVAKPATLPVKAAAVEVKKAATPGEPKSSGIIHQAVQVAFGTASAEKRPVYEHTHDPVGAPFLLPNLRTGR